MPLYDYNCPTCELTFEVSRSFADANLAALCPLCSKAAVRQVTLPMTTFTRGAAAAKVSGTPTPRSSNWYHGGHSHGPGSAPHSH